MSEFEHVKCDPMRRIIYVSGDFCQKMADEFLMTVHEVDSIDAPFTVFLSSLGGCVHALLTMVDAVHACRNATICVATGKAFSCGALFLQAFDVRLVTPSTDFMMHSAQIGVESELPRLDRRMRHMMAQEDKVISFVSERTGIPRLQIKDDCERELWLLGKEIVEAGYADGAFEPVKDRTEKREAISAQDACELIKTLLAIPTPEDIADDDEELKPDPHLA